MCLPLMANCQSWRWI